MPAPSLQRLLRHAQELAKLSSADEILVASCREVIALTEASRAFASCVLPRQTWDRGTHIEGASPRPVTGAIQSALFAIHRRLAKERGRIELQRGDETAAIFAALECPHAATIYAVPMVHRTGHIWGQLVLVGHALQTEGVDELAQQATIALESAQRLAFARRDQDRLLLLAEASDDALYEWDFDTRNFWWGGGILKLLGSDADPVENTPRWKWDHIAPDDLARVRASFEEARRAAMRWTCEYRFRRQDGTYIDVEDRGYFLRTVDGRAYRMIGSMRDTTEMKLLLAREQQARSKAERASRAKDEFLAMLGHELRNPLAPIVTGLELLRQRGTNSSELTVLQRQATHLIRLVDDLLDISRITHGKIELKRERFEISQAVLAACETARPLIEARGHALVLDVPPRGLEVDADHARIAQAIANLVNNAAKYTEPGGKIEIRAERRGERIAIRVRDNGIGIAPDMLPRVFNMFEQERQALDRSQGGLGLGLSIVRSLIELHGGTVEATSAGRGHGSVLELTIPAATQSITTEVRTNHAGAPVAPARRKIIVVDDNVDAADLLSLLLEARGNTTRVAHDAHTALQIVEEFEPDLAVLDIGLPMIDGYELAQRLRRRPREMPLRMIAVTGYGQPSDRESATRAGFDAHMVKPISIDALEAMIEKLMPSPAH